MTLIGSMLLWVSCAITRPVPHENTHKQSRASSFSSPTLLYAVCLGFLLFQPPQTSFLLLSTVTWSHNMKIKITSQIFERKLKHYKMSLIKYSRISMLNLTDARKYPTNRARMYPQHPERIQAGDGDEKPQMTTW